jgi:hypothetical protein
VVAVNLSDAAASVDLGGGVVLIGTDRARDGAAIRDGIALGPFEAVVVDLGASPRP